MIWGEAQFMASCHRLSRQQTAQLAGIGSRKRLCKEEPNMRVSAKARALHTGR